MTKKLGPPGFSRKLLSIFSRYEDSFSFEGDLLESYKDMAEESGRAKAKWWYRLQVLKAIPSYYSYTSRSNVQMINNYFKIALRNLFKQKAYSLINILGLAGGIICCLLILLFVQFELSYDNYHTHADRTYRIAMERIYPDKVRLWGWTAPPMAATVQKDFPEVEEATRIYQLPVAEQIISGHKKIVESNIVYGDSTFFDVFSIKLLEGDPKSALTKPNSVVITEDIAQKYFGMENPVGKSLQVGSPDEEYTITGVSENVPDNTHFSYDFLVSFNSHRLSEEENWTYIWRVFTYVILREGASAAEFEAKLSHIVDSYIGPQIEEVFSMPFADYRAQGNDYRLFLQPLRDIHLKSHLEQELEINGNSDYVYMFGFIAVFILFIALINFMNLTTARSANRAKEVGVRKAFGSMRGQLIRQFLLESITMSILSFLLALGVMHLILPSFSALVGNELRMDYFNYYTIPALAGFALFTGILSGSYPAFFLSKFMPSAVLRGTLSRGSKSSILRNSLVIFQFATSIGLIISTIVISNQIDYMLNKNIGYDREFLLVIENSETLGEQVTAFKNELMDNTGIVSTSSCYTYPGEAEDGVIYRPVGTNLENAVSISHIFADKDFIPTMGIELMQGRNFEEVRGTDSLAFILNETAAQALRLDDPIGVEITESQLRRNIIGVMKDFHFKSLHSDISPVLIFPIEHDGAPYVLARIKPENVRNTLSYIEEVWRGMAGDQPFTYSFLDEKLALLYDTEQKIGQVTGIFSMIAILIGCLGLFGLAAFTAEQRTKEIGVRKTLGASTPGLIYLLSTEYTKLVTISFAIAVPVSYYLMNRWLNSFAFHTDLSVWIFVSAGLLTLLVALVTVSYQTIRSALSNPIDSLRYE